MFVFLLEELKFSELRKQLLLRGLSALGKKDELRERLVQFLIAEGEDPESFEFNIKTLEELMIAAQEENRKGLDRLSYRNYFLTANSD